MPDFNTTEEDVPQAAVSRILSGLPDLLPQLEETCKDLHAHPELSMQEHRTCSVVAKYLSSLGAYTVHTGIGCTGVVGVLANGDGPTVMLRADMDALAVTEDTGLQYGSQEKGRAHACGHDMHVSWLLGVATLLASEQGRGQWSGTLLVLFQPGEETAQGARAMLDDGLFESSSNR